MTGESTKAVEVLYAYAHEDEILRDKLEKHLCVLKQQGLIKEWYDGDISPGTEWAGEIAAHLNTARIILLLVSANFLASPFCEGDEMKRAMERHERGEACVIPIILRPVDWKEALFGKLQALPKDAKPITSWPDQDEAFLEVTKGIREAISHLPPPSPPPSARSICFQDDHAARVRG